MQMGIAKKDFKEMVNSLRDQYDYDLQYSRQMAETNNIDMFPTYNNKRLFDLSIGLISNLFGGSDDVRGLLDYYVWDLNFGRVPGCGLDIDGLYAELKKLG